MVNRAAENALQEKSTSSSSYIVALEEVNEKRPGIDRDHRDLRLDPLVLQPHQPLPRNHRFVLGERIERNLYDLLETLIRAKYTKHRQRLLEDANLTLAILRSAERRGLDTLADETNSQRKQSGSEGGQDQLCSMPPSPCTPRVRRFGLKETPLA